MPNKINASVVLKNVIEIEKKGHAFYTKLSELTKDNYFKSFFKDMAGDEHNHMKIFTKMLDDYIKDTNPTSVEIPKDFEMKLIFNNVENIRCFFELTDQIQILEGVIKIEQASIDYYSYLTKITKSNDHPVILKIINEEKKHYGMALEMKTKILQLSK